MAEHISWVSCPRCAGRAAVGWLDDTPIEFDCTNGCRLTGRELMLLSPPPAPAPGPWINGSE